MIDLIIRELQNLECIKRKITFGVFELYKNKDELIRNINNIVTNKFKPFVNSILDVLKDSPLKEKIKKDKILKLVIDNDFSRDFDLLDFFEVINEQDIDNCMFQTVKVKSMLNNSIQLEAEISGKQFEVSFTDWDLSNGSIYLFLKDTFFIKLDKGNNKGVELVTKKGKVIHDYNYNIPDGFFEDDMDDPEYDSIEYIDESEDSYIGFYNSQEKLEKLKHMEFKMKSMISEFLKNIKEEDNGDDKLKNIISMADLRIYLNNRKFLDKYFYFVNKKYFNNIYFISDLHGSKESLLRIIKETDFFNNVGKNNLWIFMGDYVDKGDKDFWVLYHSLKLKNMFKDNVILLKGNHEFHPVSETGEIECIHSPSDFFDFMHSRIGNREGGKVFSNDLLNMMFVDLFSSFQIGVLLLADKNYYVSHSGIFYPQVELDFDKLYDANQDYLELREDRFPDTNSISDWNDPAHARFKLNHQGMLWTRLTDSKYKTALYSQTKELGIYSISNFMDKYGINCIIRGHEHPETGIEYKYNDKVITIFSSGGSPDNPFYENFGSVVLVLDLNNCLQVIDLLQEASDGTKPSTI